MSVLRCCSSLSLLHSKKPFPRNQVRATSLHAKQTQTNDTSVAELRTLQNGSINTAVEEKNGNGNKNLGIEPEELGVMYDDGYDKVSVKDYFEGAKDLIKSDGGPPRWFCPVECGRPINNAPLLLFLPGIEGVGMGLVLHHRSLGKAFEVRCLHMPVYDRTPFEGLLQFVEKTLKHEHEISPKRPIYLVGDSFGCCLALALAARNPVVDLTLILVNPATSFSKSPLQPLLPVLEALPADLHVTVPYLLSSVMGNPIKMALTGVDRELSPPQMLEELFRSLNAMLPLLSDLADILPRESLSWKLKLLRSGASYANSRLHRVDAQVLVLASGRDGMLPSAEEADRLWRTLKNCSVRYFKDHGHALLLEDGINLLSIIKGTRFYRRSAQHDFVEDFLPPTISEFQKAFYQDYRLFLSAINPVTYSTLENGKVVRGLSGLPNEGPVLLVGNHMLLGLELVPFYHEFLKEKKLPLRGIAHPLIFSTNRETSRQEISLHDSLVVFGALPVSPVNMYRLLSKRSFVLLYPGGAREALHRKGEEYELFWPDQPEFVRMAARFGATIVPFGVVGEDDLTELVLDYNDLSRIPFLKEWLEEVNKDAARLRAEMDGELSNQQLYLPGILPKLPGRFYYLFGKPIETLGMKDILKDRKSAKEIYLQIKSDIEHNLKYLKQKREEDPYRNVITRTLYQTSWGSWDNVPAFDP